MNSKYKLLATNTLVFAVGSMLVKLISFFLMPLYTSVLTTEQYGIAELLNNSIEIVMPVATLSVIEALYRFSIDSDTDHSTLFINSLLVVVTGDFVVIIACLVWYYIIGYEYAIYFLLLFVTTTFYKLTSQFARGLGHSKRYATYGVINSLLLVFSNIILLGYLHGGIAAYLLSFSIGYGISGIIAFFISKEYSFLKVKQFNKKKLIDMLRYSLPSIPNMLSWWVNSLSDRYIVLLFWGAGVAGLYTAASKLPAIVNLVTSIFQQAWQYSTAKEINSNDNRDFFSNVFRGYSYLCVMVCAGLIVINKLLCKVLLQSGFYVAWKYVPVLLLAATFGCIGTFFGTFYNAIKNNKMLMISTLVGALVNVVMNFALIPIIGGTGAAVATAVSYCVIMVIRMVDVKRFITIYLEYKIFVIHFITLLVASIFGCFDGPISIVIPIICFVIIVISDYKLLGIGLRFAVKRIKMRYKN